MCVSVCACVSVCVCVESFALAAFTYMLCSTVGSHLVARDTYIHTYINYKLTLTLTNSIQAHKQNLNLITD